MVPWQLLDSVPIPGENKDLRLYRRGGEFSFRVDGSELMNSRAHGSEESLAELACARIASLACPQVLIGGLGMGYTLAAALSRLGAESRVVVAEISPAVVAWNRGPLGALTGHPLADDRVSVREVDVAQILLAEQRSYDAVLLDVDNGPRGITRKSNDWLYTRTGLEAVLTALRTGGVFALWSASPDQTFARMLHKAGFEVEEKRVRARGPREGGYHTIWIARRAIQPRGVPPAKGSSKEANQRQEPL
jgi:spermidine synthase